MTANAQSAARPARNSFLDLTRGISILGILLMNIIAFGLPKSAYYNPAIDGSDVGAGLWLYGFSFVFVEGVMRALFCLLFGASVCILADNIDRVRFFKRYFLLVLIAFFDAYVLLWGGDILYDYAVAGMLLYFFRNAQPKKLLLGAAAILLLMFLVQAPTAIKMAKVDRNATVQVEYKSVMNWYAPNEAQLQAEVVRKQSSYKQLLLSSYRRVVHNQTIGYVTGRMWDVLVYMLAGMAFYRSGVFADKHRRPSFVWKIAGTALIAALAVNGFELYKAMSTQFAFYWTTSLYAPSYQLGRGLMAIAYLALIFLWCQSKYWLALQQKLISVGRMTLSNYLLQSLFGLVLFTGVGFSLFNCFSRFELYGLVLLCWVFQIFFSHWWLSRYQRGPIEWLWRYATNGVGS